jgi:hypothetical protein
MKSNWSRKLAALIEEYAQLWANSGHGGLPTSAGSPAAQIGLPVYSDLSGTLVLTPQGTIRYCDGESGESIEISDEKWVTIALVSAVEKYPDLAALLPEPPLNAEGCRECEGRGKHFGDAVLCGHCSGLGWILPHSSG